MNKMATTVETIRLFINFVFENKTMIIKTYLLKFSQITRVQITLAVAVAEHEVMDNFSRFLLWYRSVENSYVETKTYRP